MVLDHAILGLLHRCPLTGHELKKAFDRSIRHAWTADQSHIYRVLGRPAAQRYVTFESVPQEGRPNRKVYHIAPRGREELVRWLASEEARRATFRRPYLAHLFFASLLPNEQVLKKLRDDTSRWGCSLSEYEELSEQSLEGAKESPSRERFFWYLTVDYELWMMRAYLDWLDITIDQIAQGDPDSDGWSRTFPSMRPPPSGTGPSASDEMPTQAGSKGVS